MLRSQWLSYLDRHTHQLQHAEGVSFLPELAVLQFRGADVRNFLQGYLTCDTLEIRADHLTPAAVCNLQGRVVVNGWCCSSPTDTDGDAIMLIVHASLAQRLGQFFKAYLMFSKTELVDLRDAALVFGTAGVTEALAIAAGQGLIVVHELAAAQALAEQHPHRQAAAWWLGLIRAGFPLVSEATSETFLPQMLGLERIGAIDFDKGCYLGQEVVARAQHRGEVKRRLQRLLWSAPASPPPGMQFGAADDPTRKLGTVVNAIATADGTGECLAVVSNDATGPFRHDDVTFTRPD